MSAAGGGRRLFLVRHAHAGDREAWRGDDSLRPLSPKGLRQAEGIAALLAGEGIGRVLSSPSLRCVQTVEPLAARLGLPVVHAGALLEGSDAAGALDLLESFDTPVAACTHGDIVPGVLDLLRSQGVEFQSPLIWQKASTWLIQDGRARYLPPPQA